MKCKVFYYETAQGRCPVIEFLDSLEVDMRAKALRDINLLEEFGRSLKRPQTDTVKGDRYKGLYELRSKFASNITRIYYFYIEGDKAILLHGILKKSGKPPRRELETARSRMKDAQERGL